MWDVEERDIMEEGRGRREGCGGVGGEERICTGDVDQERFKALRLRRATKRLSAVSRESKSESTTCNNPTVCASQSDCMTTDDAGAGPESNNKNTESAMLFKCVAARATQIQMAAPSRLTISGGDDRGLSGLVLRPWPWPSP